MARMPMPKRRIALMNLLLHPMLASGGESYLAAMAQIELMQAYAAAVFALVIALLPWWRRGTRWLCLGLAVLSTWWVIDSYRGNQPLPWPLAELLFPLVLSAAGVFWSWRAARIDRRK